MLNHLFRYAEENFQEYQNNAQNGPDDDDDDDASEISFGVPLSDKYFLCMDGEIMIDLRCLLKYPQMRKFTDSVDDIRFATKFS